MHAAVHACAECGGLQVGCNWIELPAGSYRLRSSQQAVSVCQYECDVAFNKFVSHPPEGDWQKVGFVGWCLFLSGIR